MFFSQLAQFDDLGLFLLRIVVGIIFFYHSLPKLKDPSGIAAMMGMGRMGMMVAVLGLVELLAAIGMVLGVYVQLAALLLAVIMVGAIAMKKMKWHMPFAAMDKTGWEFDLILLAANLAIFFNGGGAIALR